MGFNYHINQGMANNTVPLKQDVQPIHSLGATMQMQTPFNEQTPSSSTGEATLITYLERQGRNEFIGLANQIGYDGKNIAFVFFENQIHKLMEESPYDERRLEVLRASCVGQPREMVNLFLALMKNISTSQRIEKALGRLRQRYSVSGGLTSEPRIVEIRNGPRVIFNVASLKAYNEDLNTLEIFAYAHNEVEKLSGQLILDTANRLPGVLKRRNLDYLTKIGRNLNHPGFDSLRDFIVHELNVMTSDYAQTFFKNDEKDKTREPNSGRGNQVRVRQVAVKTKKETQGLPQQTAHELPGNSKGSATKPPPTCFVCNKPSVKHFLSDCDHFKGLSIERQRRVVMDAGRCLNCLSTGHVVRDCSFSSKCRKWGRNVKLKHASVLHNFYVKSISVNFGAAEAGDTPGAFPAVDREGENDSLEESRVLTRKVAPGSSTILLRTSAVKVVNPRTGKATHAYAQHDTASQATLISESLKNELGLGTDHSQYNYSNFSQTIHS